MKISDSGGSRNQENAFDSIGESRISVSEAGSFLGNSGEEQLEEEEDYDTGVRIYESSKDTYETYKNKINDFYNNQI